MKASDHANVKVKAFVPPQTPRIAIVKSPKSQTLTTKLTTTKNANGATTTTVKYGTATFKIKVTNTGNVALHSVTVSDPQSVGLRPVDREPPGRSFPDVHLHPRSGVEQLHERRDGEGRSRPRGSRSLRQTMPTSSSRSRRRTWAAPT